LTNYGPISTRFRAVGNLRMSARILYIASTVSRSGPTRQLIQLLRHLDRTRFDAEVLTLSREPDDTLRSDFLALDIPVRTLGLSRLSMQLRGGRALRAAVDERQPDLIHTHGIRADLAVPRCIEGARQMATIHNYPFDDYLMAYGRLVGGFMARSHVAGMRRIPCPVAVSETIAARLRTAHGLALRVIPNGIDADLFRPPAGAERLALRRALGLNPAKRILLFSGVLIPRKDPLLLVRAFHEARLPDAVLVLLGGGPLREACRAQASASVLVLDAVPNVGEYYRAADLFLSASHSEGLPMAVLEAMASGLPVLLSDIPSHREVLEHDAAAGELFETASVASCAERLRAMLAETGDALAARSSAARALVEQRFTAQRMSGAYQELYREMLKR
jgi:glycosyltransferase involved in cell wall biosynthesis